MLHSAVSTQRSEIKSVLTIYNFSGSIVSITHFAELKTAESIKG